MYGDICMSQIMKYRYSTICDTEVELIIKSPGSA